MIFLTQQLALNLASAVDITSEHRTRQAPYKRIAANLSQYVDAEYLPDPHFKITEPRKMNRPVLLAFFQHIVQRQHTYDLPEVFRIKYADAGRKSTLGVRDSPEVEDNISGDDRPPAESTPVGVQDIIKPARGRVPKKKSKPKSKKTTTTSNIPNVTEDGGAQPSNNMSTIPGQVGPKATSKRKKGKAVGNTNVTGAADDDIVAPECRITKATKKKSKTTLRTDVPAVELNAGDPQIAPDVPDVPQQPRPKPKPKGKKATQIAVPGATGAETFTTAAGTAGPEHDIPDRPTPTRSQPNHSGMASANIVIPAPTITGIRPGPQGQSTDNVIDPALLRTTSHMDSGARPVFRTADNLALEEALQYGAPGKRVPKKRC